MNFVALLIFAASIALVFAVIAGLGKLVTSWDLGATLAATSVVFCVTFLAVLLLGASDQFRQWRLRRVVHKRLLARDDLADDGFYSAFTSAEQEIAKYSRSFIAATFHVPDTKVRPTDKLNRDYEFDVLGGVLGTSLYVLECLGCELRPFAPIAENVEQLQDVRDLVAEIHRIATITQKP